MKVAVLQVASSDDAAHNLDMLRSLLAPVIATRPDLVVLPEASQRAFGTGQVDIAAGGEPLDGPFVNGLVSMAKGSTLVAGMFERSETGEKAFNTTVVVDADGIKAAYRKIHLYDALGFAESAGVIPGECRDSNLVVVDVAGTKVGILTCFDLRFPEMAGALVAHGAEVLALGAAWVPGIRKAKQFETLLAARAIETVSYVIAAAQPTPRYCGRSQIVSPDGAILVALSGAMTGAIETTLDLELLAQMRRAMPMSAARRLGSLH